MATKKIAVLVRNNAAEALRMSLGLSLLDATVDIYVLGRPLPDAGPHAEHVETIREMEMKIYTDCKENTAFDFVSSKDAAVRLLQYDHVLPY